MTLSIRLPFTEIAAPSGTLVNISVPPAAVSANGVSSRGAAPTVKSRRTISYPGMVSTTVCLPCAAVSEHGVVHAMDELPSSVAVAPPGLLVNITSCGAATRTGAGRRSIFGNSACGALGFTASGSALAGGSGCPTGSDLAGETACPTSGAGLVSAGGAPGSGAGGLTGLGLASSGATTGGVAGGVTTGVAAVGASFFAAVPPLSGGW